MRQENGPRLTRQQRRALEREKLKGAGRARRAVASGAALTLGVAFAAGPPAQAATYNVDSLGDSGPGTLRQAILDANGNPGADVITFDAGLTGTITLTSGQLYVYDSVDIQGPGSTELMVSGNNSSRVFYLYSEGGLFDVTISGLGITEGSDSEGAGILDWNANLVLDDVLMTFNQATGYGGALWASSLETTLTIRNSVLSGNFAEVSGGAIYVDDTGGPLLIQNTRITGNNAGVAGGGVYLYDPDADTTIEDSTIAGNTAATGRGGGIYVFDTDGGTHTVRNTTVSGNSAVAGGGIFLYQPGDPVVIENSTISGNQATAGNGGGIYLYNFYANGSLSVEHTTVAGNSATDSGGGIFNEFGGTVALDQSIVGDNTAGADPDLGTGDSSFDVRFSLVENPGAASINNNGGNIFNQDPQLGPLQDNGGPTETHLPAGASPAVNAGDPAFTPPPSTDQRGFPRVVDGRIDMGSVEVTPVTNQPGTIQLAVSADSVNENAGTITIMATRTGGTQGTVSVSFATANGTAVAPGDYGAAAGTLTWLDGDSSSKSFVVTIVNDASEEPNETFSATISNPQGGATLGAITTEVVTIIDDDGPPIVQEEIPTLGDAGKVLLAALCGLGGFLLLRRKRNLAAPMLIASLALGGAHEVIAASAAEPAKSGAPAKPAKAAPRAIQARELPRAETRAATLAKVEQRGKVMIVRLADGTTFQVASDRLKLRDRRKGHRGEEPGLAVLAANQAVVVTVRHGKTGEVKRVRIELMDTAAKAQAAAQREKKSPTGS